MRQRPKVTQHVLARLVEEARPALGARKIFRVCWCRGSFFFRLLEQKIRTAAFSGVVASSHLRYQPSSWLSKPKKNQAKGGFEFPVRGGSGRARPQVNVLTLQAGEARSRCWPGGVGPWVQTYRAQYQQKCALYPMGHKARKRHLSAFSFLDAARWGPAGAFIMSRTWMAVAKSMNIGVAMPQSRPCLP